MDNITEKLYNNGIKLAYKLAKEVKKRKYLEQYNRNKLDHKLEKLWMKNYQEYNCESIIEFIENLRSNNMNIKCNHCGSVNKAAKWNEVTESYYGIGGVPIEEEIYNNNWKYRCPKCDRECFNGDRKEIEDGKS